MKSSLNSLRFFLCAVACIAMLPMNVRADYPVHGLYLGVYGGYMQKLGDWDLGSAAADGTIQPKSPLVGGARLGFHILPQMIAEIGGGFLPLTSTSGGKNTGLKADIDLYFHLLRGDNSPFIGLGGGSFMTLTGGDLGGDTDMQLHVSLGIRGLLSRAIALRLELRDYMVDDYNHNIGWGQNLEVSAGIDFYLSGGEKKPRPPADRDNDGVPDSLDKCPDEAGKSELQGCPDRDHDGVPDALDKCPDEAGDPARDGCPERDRDGDGVPDEQDKCPDEAGPAVLEGCPDRDGDGVADKDDQCPDQAGPRAFGGCPDRDGDGVPDKDDKCPDVTGLPDYEGCVPEAVKKFTGAIKGINFKSGSATILPVSYAILDQTVMVMQEYNSLRLRIEGHTDNVGNPDANLRLSENRAESVKTYIMSKGIDFSRIETVGYGDTRPVESNRTASGRAINRRIEFSILGQ